MMQDGIASRDALRGTKRRGKKKGKGVFLVVSFLSDLLLFFFLPFWLGTTIKDIIYCQNYYPVFFIL